MHAQPPDSAGARSSSPPARRWCCSASSESPSRSPGTATGGHPFPAAWAAATTRPAPAPPGAGALASTPNPGCDPWGCDQQRRLAAAAGLVRTGPGQLGIIVLDRQTGAVWTAGTAEHRMWASSTPKLALATSLLERARRRVWAAAPRGSPAPRTAGRSSRTPAGSTGASARSASPGRRSATWSRCWTTCRPDPASTPACMRSAMSSPPSSARRCRPRSTVPDESTGR